MVLFTCWHSVVEVIHIFSDDSLPSSTDTALDISEVVVLSIFAVSCVLVQIRHAASVYEWFECCLHFQKGKPKHNPVTGAKKNDTADTSLH